MAGSPKKLMDEAKKQTAQNLVGPAKAVFQSLGQLIGCAINLLSTDHFIEIVWKRKTSECIRHGKNKYCKFSRVTRG